MLRIERYEACTAFSPSARHFEMALALAAALRRRIADARFHQPFLLEPLERGVNGADRHAAAAALFDLAAHRGAVRVGAKAQQREHHHLFEFTEKWRGL